jgi:hypothetical protein
MSEAKADEGLAQRADCPRIETPHPALRATFSRKGRREEDNHAASVFSTSLIQYEVPNTIASSLKL